MVQRNTKPVHPGEVLLEQFLKPLRISQTTFVQYLGGTWTQPKLSAIIAGKRAVTESIALDFADALGTKPEFWLNLQVDINLWEAQLKRKRIKLLPRLKRHRLAHGVIPHFDLLEQN